MRAPAKQTKHTCEVAIFRTGKYTVREIRVTALHSGKALSCGPREVMRWPRSLMQRIMEQRLPLMLLEGENEQLRPDCEVVFVEMEREEAEAVLSVHNQQQEDDGCM